MEISLNESNPVWEAFKKALNDENLNHAGGDITSLKLHLQNFDFSFLGATFEKLKTEGIIEFQESKLILLQEV